jgi:hypothetical protein
MRCVRLDARALRDVRKIRRATQHEAVRQEICNFDAMLP